MILQEKDVLYYGGGRKSCIVKEFMSLIHQGSIQRNSGLFRSSFTKLRSIKTAPSQNYDRLKQHHNVQETCNNCFGSKIRSTTLRQAKTGKHESRNVTAMCCEFLASYGVAFQSAIQ